MGNERTPPPPDDTDPLASPPACKRIGAGIGVRSRASTLETQDGSSSQDGVDKVTISLFSAGCDDGTIVRSRGASFADQATERPKCSTTENDHEIVHAPSPRSSCSVNTSPTTAPSTSCSPQDELSLLRAQVSDLERQRCSEMEEVSSLQQQLAEAQLFARQQQEQVERLAMQNRLLLAQWHDAMHAQYTYQCHVQHSISVTPAAASEPCYLRSTWPATSEQSTAESTYEFSGLQTTPVFSH